ncbi:uncharacterized protein LOC126908527 [Daktulosphaira vitifoliae]|uniref:uncharacterized protein LOC126908527 n=1 Tax=Daktulosphaira vitifoliae TaxID=58002 RepID=UPI0021AA5476|nr:uncharacterized protein LOC126908527 [Daktulosphaira vitifoliae]
MNLELFVLKLTLIYYNITYVECKIEETSYLNYLIEIGDHLCIQNGWKSMGNLHLKHDSIGFLSVQDLVAQKLNEKNLISVFYNIIDILNYRYSEVLSTFVELLNIVVDICVHFLDANVLENFKNCTILLVKIINNSLTMFDNIYNAMTFISYMDFKLVFPELKTNPITIVHDIYEIKNHIYFKKIQSEYHHVDYQVFIETKEFIGDVFKIANNCFEKNKSIINTGEKIDLKTECETEYLTHNRDFSEFIQFMCNKMNSFYTETIKINYEDLGFIQLINPTNNKFKPPIDESINQELGIMTLNTLFSEGNWDSFGKIKILFDNLIVSATTVIRDLVTDHNFHLKKFYFTQMLRCRLLDVLLMYNTSLTALSGMCRSHKELNEYLKCIIYLFDTINNTVKMFDYMLTIMEKIKLSTLWLPEKLCPSLRLIFNLIYNYVIELKTNDVIRNMFINKPEVNIENLANDYMVSFQKARYKFFNNLRNLKSQNKYNCYSEGLIVNKEHLDIKFSNAELIINTTMATDSFVTKYELLSKYLYEFCENFVKTDYIDTGFHKIHQHYFWQWP